MRKIVRRRQRWEFCLITFSDSRCFISQVFLNHFYDALGVHFTIGAAYSGGCSPLCCVSQIWKYNIRGLFSSRYQFMSICKQNCEIFKCRLFVLLTIKQSLTKLQKQIKKILVIMSMSPPPSKPSTLEKKQVKLWNSSHTVDIILNKGQPTGQLDRILVILSI